MGNDLAPLYKEIPPDGSVLDVGCFGFSQMRFANSTGMSHVKHYSVDYNEYTRVPKGFVFRRADLNRELIPFDNDQFSLVVASHIIEHVVNPVAFFGDCIRVCKPGGLVHF